MRTYQHKTKWLVFWRGGGVTECISLAQARILALNYSGVFCIRSPIYVEEK